MIDAASSQPKVDIWNIKDSSGEVVTVKATDWVLDEWGLIFKLGNEKIAVFSSWIYYVKTGEE